MYNKGINLPAARASKDGETIMGFFDMFKKKAEPAAPAGPIMVAADAKGAVVKIEDIPDEVFAQGILCLLYTSRCV